jgi:hypothetical protein
MKKFIKVFLLSLLVLFVLIQFYPRGEKNQAASPATSDITAAYQVPADAQSILKTSCYDCHSNNTNYPWYSRIQPVALWLEDHIKEGKKELNFSEFATYRPSRQYKKFKEIAHEVEEGEMPLNSYIIIHRDAVLSEAQRTTLVSWAKNEMKGMESRFPVDSLVVKKK